MELAEPQIRDILLDESDEFRGLATQHAEFETRLEELSSKHLPSEPQRIEEIEIKKHKLLLKDRMATMIRDYKTANLAAVTH